MTPQIRQAVEDAVSVRLIELRSHLAAYKDSHYSDQMTDNRYATSGRSHAAVTRIKKTEAEIKLLEAALTEIAAEACHG